MKKLTSTLLFFCLLLSSGPFALLYVLMWVDKGFDAAEKHFNDFIEGITR